MGRFHTALACVLACAFPLVVGCFHSVESTVGIRHGLALPDEALAALQRGQTTREWVVGVFGPPAGSTQLPDGTEELAYDYAFRRTTESGMIGSKHHKTTSHFIHVRIRIEDGVVAGWTREQMP